MGPFVVVIMNVTTTFVLPELCCQSFYWFIDWLCTYKMKLVGCFIGFSPRDSNYPMSVLHFNSEYMSLCFTWVPVHHSFFTLPPSSSFPFRRVNDDSINFQCPSFTKFDPKLLTLWTTVPSFSPGDPFSVSSVFVCCTRYPSWSGPIVLTSQVFPLCRPPSTVWLSYCHCGTLYRPQWERDPWHVTSFGLCGFLILSSIVWVDM